MSYLVLARKWRPKRFAELVGQQHVVRALMHALETGRIHHAFLFSGTRGVGKTTIARIFAKSLNCELGQSSDPCGECGTCKDIDSGRYPDLIEIDAASNTGVDDVRSLIESAQYMPSRGRCKVYLIDEVHMLSKNAFNALLKTLEEPPEHVKFLLATTDPEKLPVTVLSRCLQFNLRRLDREQIVGQMQFILQQEQIEFDQESLVQLAISADGSLRDALSLLDQAIAYCGGSLRIGLVQAMLGTVDRHQIEQLLTALSSRDGEALMTSIEQTASLSPDFSQVLMRLAESLHDIQLLQLIPSYQAQNQKVSVQAFAKQLDPQIVQLWYQMASNGANEITRAPSPRIGFEMCLLRMLAFLPLDAEPIANTTSKPSTAAPALNSPKQDFVKLAPSDAQEIPVTVATMASSTQTLTVPNSSEQWMHFIKQLNLKGPEREVGAHAAFVQLDGAVLQLAYPEDLLPNLSDALRARFLNALNTATDSIIQIQYQVQKASTENTLFAHETQQKFNRQQQAEAEFHKHPAVSALLQEGAQIVPESIRSIEN